ncbi:hypothetical protein EIK77_010330 [Talaromyces pinophilus]|nr:hypothetical protein EIK77_010330 [Talaromyces pinophilus]
MSKFITNSEHVRIFSSLTFTFLIGEEKLPQTIHVAAVKSLSAPLHALISNGSMSESQTGVATLEDVDVKTFGLFIEYAYKGDYETPMLAKVNRSTGTDMTSSGPISKRNRNDIPGLWKVEEAYRNFTNATGVGNGSLADHIYIGLWESFKARTFGAYPAKTPHRPDLLSIAKLYIFATRYLVEPLRQKCLATLHLILTTPHLTKNIGPQSILDLLEFAYLNTGVEPTGDLSTKSLLRDLVIHYAASKLLELSKYEAFFDLLESNAEMSSDLVKEMVK